MGSSHTPAKRDPVPFRDNFIDRYLEVGHRSEECAMDLLECLRSHEGGVVIGKAVAFAGTAQQFLDGCLTLLVPAFLDPALQQSFVCLGHIRTPTREEA